MRFPKREAEIVRLAEDLCRGLLGNPEAFPAPIVPVPEIQQLVAEYESEREVIRYHRAMAMEGTARKHRVLQKLTRLMKGNLRYAEYTAGGEPGRLESLGWSGPKSPNRNGHGVPGQVLHLEVLEEGENWVALGWEAPMDGGPVSAYRIQRRRRLGGNWTEAGSSPDTGIRLNEQETGVELEYRVNGFSEVGEGPVSNVVRVVL